MKDTEHETPNKQLPHYPQNIHIGPCFSAFLCVPRVKQTTKHYPKIEHYLEPLDSVYTPDLTHNIFVCLG